MIKIVYGDIFDQDVDVLVNPVNCVGVMGAGLARQFKIRYPKMFDEYQILCQSKQMLIGKPHWYFSSKDNKWIINFPTKNHWKDPSKLEFIEKGLRSLQKGLIHTHPLMEIKTIAIPSLGCGLGGLDWKDVKPLIYKYLSDLSVDVIIVLNK